MIDQPWLPQPPVPLTDGGDQGSGLQMTRKKYTPQPTTLVTRVLVQGRETPEGWVTPRVL